MLPSTLRLLIALIAGILMETYSVVPLSILYAVCAIALLWTILFVSTRIPIKPSMYLMPVHGCMIYALWICTGYFASALHDPRLRHDWIAYHLQPGDQWIGICRSSAVEKPASFQYLIEARYLIHPSGSIQKCSGKVLTYLHKAAYASLPRMGDMLLISRTPEKLSHHANPGTPDFANYLEHQHIYHQVFLDSTSWKWYRHVSHEQSLNFRTRLENLFNQLKTSFRNKLQFFLPDQHIRALAYALITGDRNDLNPDMIQAFRSTGTIHILAISGLHIGILFGVCMFILRLFRLSSLISLLVALVCTWMFVFFSGMAPSACRAAFMITLITLPRWILKRPVSSLDACICSAIVLLLIQPSWIMDVGFQLSYLAVAGILLYYSFFYQLLQLKNRFAKKLWGMLAVSLSAQILILPLSIYDFHQFPILFLITNLIAVPLSSILLILTCAFLIVPWHVLSFYIAKLILLTGLVLHHSLAWFHALKWNRIENVFISFPQMIGMFIFLITTMAFLMKRVRTYLWMMFMSFLGLWMSIDYALFQSIAQRKFIVYHIPHASLLEWVQGRKSVCWLSVNADLQTDFKDLAASKSFFHIRQQNIITDTTSGTHVFTWNRMQFIQLDGRKPQSLWIKEITRPCFMIITHNARPDSIQLKRISPRAIIVDGTNARPTITKWKNVCEQLNLHFHATSEDGAFVLNP